MSSHKLILLSSALIGAFLLQPTTTLPIAQIPLAPVSAPSVTSLVPVVEADYGQIPLYFVENQGQMDERVAYYIQGSDKTIYFTPEGVTFALTARETVTDTARAEQQAATPARGEEQRRMESAAPTTLQRWTVKLDFVDANPNVRPVAEEQAEAVFSYFTGKPDEWHAGLRSYRKLVYLELWPGIDLVYYGTVNHMKYEFIVKPGADPDKIRLAYRGATDVRLDAAGQMEVSTPIGGFQDDTPVAYQDIDGQRVSVSMAYAFAPKSSPKMLNPEVDNDNTHAFGFALGEYDPTQALVLDPTLLVYAGYIGGEGADRANSIAVDAAGSAYITGGAGSNQTTFPELSGPDLTYNGSTYDSFVAKVNAAGTALVYAGYIGGSGDEWGNGIAVDSAGNAYVTGETGSDETTFPVLGGPDVTHNGSGEAFVAKVNAAGTALVYAGYIGGASYDGANSIAVDSAGSAYVTGFTSSNQATFPVQGGPDVTYNGGDYDSFVAKVNAAGTALVYAGYIGGAALDRGHGIAVDGVGSAYVAGETWSTQSTFPVLGGLDVTLNGQRDAFAAKVNAAGTALIYAGYIGGAGDDWGYDIAVDGAGSAYVSGMTDSDQSTFPVWDGPDVTHNGLNDAFVAKLNAAGTALVYAGYIGGTNADWAKGIAVDGAGSAYVAGYAVSNQATFPVLGGPDVTFNGVSDAFVAKISDLLPTHTISGRVLSTTGQPLAGVGISAGAGGNATTDANGSYQLTSLAAGSYTLTPSLSGHVFTPPTTTVVVPPNQNPVDFVATQITVPPLYAISGRITSNTNQPLAGVTVYAGPGGSATTDASGSYQLTGLAAGSYTMTPRLDGYAFTPPTTTIGVPPSQTSMNFVAARSVLPAGKPVVVLVHGWLGASSLSDTCQAEPTQYQGLPGDPDVGFFEKIPAAIREAGYAVYFAHIASSFVYTPSIGDNTRCLANQLDWLRDNQGATSFILVAHSMGGLVARGYVDRQDLYPDGDVQTLITLGTPHEGTPIHLWLPVVLGPLRGSSTLAAICVLQVAVCDFTEERTEAINSLYPPATNTVRYHFVGGAALESERNWRGRLTGILLMAGFQDDGIVTTTSSRALSLSGDIDRFLTTENHNVFGEPSASPNYFNDVASPSALDCILEILHNPSSATCRYLLASSSADSNLDLPQANEPNGVLWPIDYRTLAADATYTRSVIIDAGPALFAGQWATGTVAVTLQDPAGTLWGPSEAAVHPDVMSYTQDLTGATYSLHNAPAGTWRIVLRNLSQPAAATETMSVIIAASAINVTGVVDQSWYAPGQTAMVTATLTGAPATAVVTATLNTADGASLAVPLTPGANGQFTGSVIMPTVPGYADLKVWANGTSAQGASFERTSAALFQVSSGKFLLADSYQAELEPRTPGSHFAAALRLNVGIHATGTGRLALAGDLVDTHGTVVAHALTTIEVVAGDQTVQIRFPADDIRRSGLSGPYTLTNVVLADESGATLIADTAGTVYVTPAYAVERFGEGLVYLPLVRK